MVILVTEKHPKQLFYSSKIPLLVTVTLWRNARFDVILTSVTIIKQGFIRKLFCYESLVNTDVSKHLIIDTSYSLGSSDVITNVNILTPLDPFIFYENKRRIHGCLK